MYILKGNYIKSYILIKRRQQFVNKFFLNYFLIHKNNFTKNFCYLIFWCSNTLDWPRPEFIFKKIDKKKLYFGQYLLTAAPDEMRLKIHMVMHFYIAYRFSISNIF